MTVSVLVTIGSFLARTHTNSRLRGCWNYVSWCETLTGCRRPIQVMDLTSSQAGWTGLMKFTFGVL